MRGRYLEVTFRKGRPVAAYLYLPRANGAKSARTEPADEGILVDYAATGEPIGVELTAPAQLDAEALNAVLAALGQPRVDAEEIAPLKAA